MMKLRWLMLVMTLLAAAAGIGAQQAEPRVALVIGNAAYASKPLKNPVNDARAIAATLRRLGFTVVLKENATLREMVTAVREFGASLPAKGAALIYYSGHGAQLKDKNYLIPIGADIRKEADLEFEGMDAGRLLSELERSGERVGILILDACRSNPFASDARSSSRGLLPLQAPAGTVVAYATGPGLVADDNPDGANGLYTEELLKHMQTPGLKIEDVFKRTRAGVMLRSRNKQTPKEDFALVRDFSFFPGALIPVGVVKATVALVEITSTPAGARIYLDGVDTGKVTPAVLEEDLGATPRRTAEVELRAAGKSAKKERVVLQAGRQSEVQISLEEEFTPGRIARVQLGGETVEMVGIPGGEFMMGMDRDEIDRIWSRFGWDEDWKKYAADEGPVHRVKVSGFELGVTEVTVGQFQAYCRATGKEMPKQEDWNNTAQHPVHNVTWDEAVGFCEWATGELKRQGLPGSVRLPTEAEWEYAARGGDTGLNGRARKVFVWGNDLPRTATPVGNLADAGAKAIYSSFSVFPNYDDGYRQTAPVGGFPANAFGLRDMAGNVFEWCQDRYDEEYYAKSPVENPQGSNGSDKRLRVRRGGSWVNGPASMRASYRSGFDPGYRGDTFGFRLARTPRP